MTPDTNNPTLASSNDCARNFAFDLGFCALSLDHMAARREDMVFLAAMRAHGEAQYGVFVDEEPLCRRAETGLRALWTKADLAALDFLGAPAVEIFLGVDPSFTIPFAPLFALHYDDANGAAKAKIAQRALADEGGLELSGLRALALNARVEGPAASLLGHAKSLLSWHRRHGFCASCGAKTALAGAGHKRVCVACETEHFPRVDPVVIMLIHKGDQCLLGRGKRFQTALYSCLAGFMAPGETIEQAVRREVFEETGIGVGKVAYLACQPWPFPSSLMLGCTGEALTGDIMIDHEELEDARWFSREEVRLMLTGAHPQGYACPQAMTMGANLLAMFAAGG